MIDYNCNENNEDYYKKVRSVVEEYYDSLPLEEKFYKNSDGSFDYDFELSSALDICILPTIIRKLGYKVIYAESERTGYQGDIYILYTENDKDFYFFDSSYGSCSVCDVWECCTENPDVFMKNFRQEDRRTTKFSKKDRFKFFKERHIFGSGAFIQKALEDYIKNSRLY